MTTLPTLDPPEIHADGPERSSVRRPGRRAVAGLVALGIAAGAAFFGADALDGSSDEGAGPRAGVSRVAAVTGGLPPTPDAAERWLLSEQQASAGQPVGGVGAVTTSDLPPTPDAAERWLRSEP